MVKLIGSLFVAGAFLVAALGAQTVAPAPAGISWARIPSGVFQMGCVPADSHCGVDESPRHAVTISRPFDLMTTEVTVGMYRASRPSIEEQPPWSTSAEHPVVIVTWDNARVFCRAVGGRLPTEAEWEYAARGGREGSIYPWGDQLPTDKRGATNGAAFEGDRPLPVKSYTPNGYGLYDMAGNVWEWTDDANGLYREDAVTDPLGPAAGSSRILRGGSFGDDAELLRVSNRTPNQPDRVNLNVGFRCARDAPATAPAAARGL